MKKLAVLTALFASITIPALAHERETVSTVVETGVGLGSVIAVVTSWSRNQSVAWAIIHGILSWLYVIYFVLTRSDKP